MVKMVPFNSRGMLPGWVGYAHSPDNPYRSDYDTKWDSTTRTLTALGFSVTVGTNSDKTGYALSTAGVLAIWHQLLSAIATSGSVGKLIKDNLDAAISSITPTDITALDAKVDDIKALIAGINDSTNNIAADLERIAGGLAGGLTAGEADGVIAELQAAADKLKSVADTTPE